MQSLEEEMREQLAKCNIGFTDNSGSPTKLDFRIAITEKCGFWLEVKEKRQHTKKSNWPEIDIPEEHLFILDDLSARKLLRHSPLSGLAVRNNVTGRYYFIDVVTLFLMPKLRVNRLLNERGELKGKWMIDIRNGTLCGSSEDVIRAMYHYTGDIEKVFTETACYGYFVNEHVGLGGEFRTQEQRKYDYAATR